LREAKLKCNHELSKQKKPEPGKPLPEAD